MTEFNGRYNEMNDGLQRTIWSGAPFSEAEKIMFIDYFNLCAEEWLFWKKGYIDDVIWQAWENGMLQYSKDARVSSLWNDEAKSNSYYGFSMPTV